jgi:hypothetical protein
MTKRILLASVALASIAFASPAFAEPYGTGCWSIADAADCTATDAAIDATIAAAVAAPPEVRAAFTADVCSMANRDDIVDHTEARDALPDALRSVYDAIGELLLAVYRTVEPTDGELEAVTADFCDGLTEQD